ncbi:unnamed protein product [Brassica rapa]|uniref:Uncharacterized protein n=1 Tax=Brassica campestris TaxID=3711 RepID=A0A8D9GB91_BRACM|nr:unnamed protein product [Brassica rapa]
MCVLTDTHGHTRTATDILCVLADTHGRPVCTEQTAHVGQNPPNSPREGSVPRTNMLICVLMDSHRRPVCPDGHRRTHTDTHGQPQRSYSPRGPKSPEQSTGRASMLSPRTRVLICVLMDSHGYSVCADGYTQTHTESHGHRHTRTATDVLCELADTHGCPMCAEQTAHVGQNHPNSPREGSAC